MVTPRRSAPRHRHRLATLAASLVALHFVIVAPASAQAQGAAPAASEANKKKAVELFKKGQALSKANKCGEALPVLRESYSLVESPNSQIYIARCLAGTNDLVGAYLEFTALIADVDGRKEAKYQPTRDSAVTERDEIAAKISFVTVNVANPTPDTRVTVGLKEIARDQWGKAIPLMPGTVDVTLSAPPAAPQTQNLELTAGQKKTINLDTAGPATGGGDNPPPSTGGSRKILRPISYAAAGVGVVGMGMFAVAGALASATYSDLDSKCTKGTGQRACSPDLAGQINDGKVQKDLANVGLIIGAVGLAAGVTLFIVSREPGKKDEAPRPEVQAVVGPSYLGLQGSF
jgi:phenylpyruvate tautomerase PptA (4-oxalocrotonate tautomerase family)